MGKSYETYGSADVVCPFYQGESFEKNLALIRCEGLYEGTVSTLSARSHGMLKKHKELFCNSMEGCRRCRFYQIANAKYE